MKHQILYLHGKYCVCSKYSLDVNMFPRDFDSATLINHESLHAYATMHNQVSMPIICLVRVKF